MKKLALGGLQPACLPFIFQFVTLASFSPYGRVSSYMIRLSHRLRSDGCQLFALETIAFRSPSILNGWIVLVIMSCEIAMLRSFLNRRSSTSII